MYILKYLGYILTKVYITLIYIKMSWYYIIP